MQPLITVLIPTFNSAIHIIDAIDSVLTQSLGDFEIFILDGGSTDETLDLVRRLDDRRLTVFSHPGRFSLVDSLNEGLEAARGEYIARMDADDLSIPGRFDMQAKFLATHPDVDVVGSFIRTFGISQQLWTFPIFHDAIKAALLFDTALAHPTVMMKAKTLRNLDVRYRTDYAHAEDYGIWNELVRKGARFHNLPKVLLKYRLHPSQTGLARNAAQIANGDLIRKDWLTDLGINPSCEEIELHRRCASKNWKYSRDFISAMNRWFSKIERGNQTRRIFSPKELQVLLSRKRMGAAVALRRSLGYSALISSAWNSRALITSMDFWRRASTNLRRIP